jgi:hypothetical protein
MNGRRRTGEVVYLIHFQIDGIGDVVADALKVLVSQKVADIVFVSGKKVVETQDLMSLEKQPFAEMRTDKTGAPGDKNPFHEYQFLKKSYKYDGWPYPK